jgi:hypothetical protein
MSFIECELQKLSRALIDAPEGAQRSELYAAQQALLWAMEPAGFQSPHDMITGSAPNSKDCSVDIRPCPSANKNVGKLDVGIR